MAMGNSPMIYIDANGRTWKIFELVGNAVQNAWHWAWDKGNQYARWADKVGIPSFNIGYGISSSGQVQPIGDINGQPLFSNEAQYEAAAQNAVDAINDARGDYFSQQGQIRASEQRMTHQILQIGLYQGQDYIERINIGSVCSQKYLVKDKISVGYLSSSNPNVTTPDLLNELGSLNTIYSTAKPNKITPKIGWVFTGVGVYKNIKSGSYPEAMWTVIEGVGGIYSLGGRGLYHLSQTEYMQTGVGRMAYNEYMYNVRMYELTKNDIFLKRASRAERTMKRSYYNLIRKK